MNFRTLFMLLNSFTIVICSGFLIGCAATEPERQPADNAYPFDRKDFAAFVEPVEFRPVDSAAVVFPESRDGDIVLSVEQALLSALRNNRDLRVRHFSPVIEGAFEHIERGVFDPELFAEYQYFEEEATETSRSTGERFDVVGTESDAVLGLRKLLPTGTALEAIASHDRSDSDRAPEQQAARIGLTITQSLLEGWGPAVNLAGIRQAEYETLASRQELRGFAEALMAETEIAYWNYVLAGEEIAIFEESLQVARQQLEDVELRIEVGLLPEIEVAAARTEEALRVQALIDARSQLEDRRLRLIRLISPGPENHFERQVVATSRLDIVSEPLADLDDRLQLAGESRPDLHEARLRLQQDRLETVVTRNGLLPKLDLFVTFGKTGYADSFSDSFRQLDQDTYDLTAGLRLSHVLGNRASRAQNLAAFAARQQAAEAVANLK